MTDPINRLISRLPASVSRWHIHGGPGRLRVWVAHLKWHLTYPALYIIQHPRAENSADFIGCPFCGRMYRHTEEWR